MKIYLALPYSGMGEASFEMREGHIVFSPISHSHPIAISHNGVAFNGANLILKSKGVQGEIAKAQEQGKEICSIHYHDDDYF